MERIQYESPVGPMILTAQGEFLTEVRFGTVNAAPSDSGVLRQTAVWLDGYFAGNPGELPPMEPKGTEFQKKVWKLLLEIPYGQTLTYGELARRLGNPRASQAVGQAVGRNPIAILVPCHRVVGSKGTLTGYAYGVEKKRWLLFHEGAGEFRG